MMNKLYFYAGRCLVGVVCAAYSLFCFALEPKSADFNTIAGAQSEVLVVWQYAPNPEILIFDFPSLAQQGRTFNRITQLTEQANEPYKSVLTEAQLLQRLQATRRTQSNMAYGHDVTVKELVLFFNLVKRDKVPLFQEETELLDFLLAQGLMRDWRGFYQAIHPNKVLLSIPQPQTVQEGGALNYSARQAILLHEMAHGEYYTNPYYADYCRRFWYLSLSEQQRRLFKLFLAKSGYVTNQDELVVNEMQAYLMFTPDVAAFSASKLGVSDKELEAMREAFRRGKPSLSLPLQ